MNPTISIENISPVAALEDLITAKLCATFDRRKARDFLDLDAILASGSKNVQELYELLHEQYPEVGVEDFRELLLFANRPELRQDYITYNLDADAVEGITARLRDAAARLTKLKRPSFAERVQCAEAAAKAHNADADRQLRDRRDR